MCCKTEKQNKQALFGMEVGCDVTQRFRFTPTYACADPRGWGLPPLSFGDTFRVDVPLSQVTKSLCDLGPPGMCSLSSVHE